MDGFSLDSLATRLPFAVDDYPAAGRAFAAWRESGADADKETVELWAYCYVRRHVIGRFARERTGGAADVDAAISRAYEQVTGSFHKIEQPLRFPHYVSVICKRVVLRHRDRRAFTVEADDAVLPRENAVEASPYEAEAVHAAVLDAFDTLPPAVVEIARLRLLEHLEYEEIAERVGRPVPTVRTYVARAREALRADPVLRAHHFDDVLPPGADPEAEETGRAVVTQVRGAALSPERPPLDS